jgi:hypothetical protein
MLRGEMIVMVKCRGEEAGNMLMRRTRRSTHNDRGALVNVHDYVHRCCLDKGKARLSFDRPIECRACRFKKKNCLIALANRDSPSIPQSRGVPYM